MSKEKWLPVPEFEGIYEASSLGGIRSLSRDVVRHTAGGSNTTTIKERLIVGGPHKSGYNLIHLFKNGKRTVTTRHAVVASAFLGPRPIGMDVCHKDGVKSNCRLSNLMYGSKAENEQHKVLHGTVLKGESQPVSKLTETQAREILMNDVDDNKVLAERYGVTHSNISAIRRGKS
ncbi:MAG: NUMOD4 motif-containing HNH endonuclease [Gammaproteobacteria bacterium]|nr:NUMOD4 motif-containing HNH endonuclease [Gammaproteobacteria bacterium]MDP2346847.1 NUMOD4 motif-containing HNH endonuclease [Gammaproteobacteria bacterium]